MHLTPNSFVVNLLKMLTFYALSPLARSPVEQIRSVSSFLAGTTGSTGSTGNPKKAILLTFNNEYQKLNNS